MAQTCALILPFQLALHRLSCSNETIQDAAKHYEMLQIHELWFQWGGSGVSIVKKFQCDFMAQTCALIAPFQPVLHRISSINETLPNAPKHYKTHKNISLGINWVDRVRSFWKILTRLHGTNLCIILPFQPALHRLSCSNKIIQNAPNHEFRVQCGGSGVFVVKIFWCDFIAQTCPLIAPVQPILHRVSCSNETLPNAHKTKKCSKTWV